MVTIEQSRFAELARERTLFSARAEAVLVRLLADPDLHRHGRFEGEMTLEPAHQPMRWEAEVVELSSPTGLKEWTVTIRSGALESTLSTRTRAGREGSP